MMSLRALLFAALAVLPDAALPMSAEDFVHAAIRPGWMTDTGTRMAAIEISLAPGWHTYWRQPGAAGIPPQLDLTGSANLAAAAIHWPLPTVIDQNGLTSLGFLDRVVLPLELTPAGPGPIALRARLDIGVCDDICVPVEFTFDAALTGAGTADPEIAAALARQPMTARAAGFAQATCLSRTLDDGLRLTMQIDAAAAAGTEFAVIETGDLSIWVSTPEITQTQDTYSLAADLVAADAQPFLLDRSAMKLTLLKGGSGLEFNGCTGG